MDADDDGGGGDDDAKGYFWLALSHQCIPSKKNTEERDMVSFCCLLSFLRLIAISPREKGVELDWTDASVD